MLSAYTMIRIQIMVYFPENKISLETLLLLVTP
jgi:hypothetical protein